MDARSDSIFSAICSGPFSSLTVTSSTGEGDGELG